MDMAAAQDMAADRIATLGEDLQNVIDHAAALLDALPGDGDARLGSLRVRVSESIDSARAHLHQMQTEGDRPSERAAAALERWIEDNPWMVVAIGAGIGVAAGVVLARRRNRRPARRGDASTPTASAGDAPAASAPGSR